MPGPTPLITSYDSSIALRTSTQRRNEIPIGYNETPQIHPPNCPFPFDDHHQNLIHPYQARPHSPPQTASRSNQPCCHYSHVQTNKWDWRMFSNMSALLAILIESDALIIYSPCNSPCVASRGSDLHKCKKTAVYTRWHRKQQKSYNSNINHNNIDINAKLLWLMLPFYDFAVFVLSPLTVSTRCHGGRWVLI